MYIMSILEGHFQTMPDYPGADRLHKELSQISQINSDNLNGPAKA
jgi:hypothetical protein